MTTASRSSSTPVLVTRTSWVIGALIVLGAGLWKGPWFALNTAGGAALAIFNLYIFDKIGRAFQQAGRHQARWGALAFLKLGVLCGAAWLFVRQGLWAGIAFGLGYATLPFSVTIGSLLSPFTSADENEQANPPVKTDGSASPDSMKK